MKETYDDDRKVITWQHPTGRLPRRVMIVGLGPSKADLLDATSGHTPLDLVMNVDEVWGVNAGINQFAGRIHYDLVFMMDYLEGEARKYPKYIQYLERYLDRFKVPVITSEAGQYRELDGIHEYPLHWLYCLLGADALYLHNSIPYMIAYAVAIGVEELIVWGCDYSHERFKHREDDRACAEYWIGAARRGGMSVSIPDVSSLCSADKGLWFYGYQNQPLRGVFEKLKADGVRAELVGRDDPPTATLTAVKNRS